MGLRVLVCGGRDYDDTDNLWAALDRVAFERGIDVLIHGAAPGADTLACQWAEASGVECIGVPAKWEEYGRSAGPRRNREMLEQYKPDAVVAFPGGRGTRDMVTRARAAGVPVWEPKLQRTG